MIDADGRWFAPQEIMSLTGTLRKGTRAIGPALHPVTPMRRAASRSGSEGIPYIDKNGTIH